MSRRTARGQKLPPQEVEFLNSLSKEEKVQRSHDLYHAGWALDSIGSALLPKRPRTTIRSWVQRVEQDPNTTQITIDAPIPTPAVYSSTESSPSEDGIPSEMLQIIQELAPLARTYRSRMSDTTAAAVANDRLTGICITLYQKGVSIKDLAAAAGVTYRAMYKRVKL